LATIPLSPPPLLYRYIAKEVFSPFWTALFVFTGILFLARALKLVELVVNKNVPAGDIILLFSYIIPRFLEVAIPMALLLAIIVAFGRLSHDSELVVLRAAGLSLKRLAIPVMLFAALAFFFSVIIAFWIRPWANHRLGLGLFDIAKNQASAGLVAGVFNELGQLTIYAERIESTGGNLDNVLIGDRRNPNLNRLFIAKHGKIISDQRRRAISLQLYDGSIAEGRGQDFTVTYFEINNISLPLSALVDDSSSRSGKRSSEMYLGELITALNTLKNLPALAPTDRENDLGESLAKYQVELHKRLALPFSCLCVALIAMALGIQPSRGGQTWSASTNVAIGIGLILFYYILIAVATALGEQMIAPAWLVMWAPNFLFACLGLYLFERMGSEQWMAVSQMLGEKLRWLFDKLKITSTEQPL
jgi:lipopolysaccharide export system permease protein